MVRCHLLRLCGPSRCLPGRQLSLRISDPRWMISSGGTLQVILRSCCLIGQPYRVHQPLISERHNGRTPHSVIRSVSTMLDFEACSHHSNLPGRSLQIVDGFSPRNLHSSRLDPARQPPVCRPIPIIRLIAQTSHHAGEGDSDPSTDRDSSADWSSDAAKSVTIQDLPPNLLLHFPTHLNLHVACHFPHPRRPLSQCHVSSGQ